MKKSIKIAISGGGTGGHIYPALSIAQELQKQYPDAEFLFVGAKDKMEMEKVPAAGFPIEGLWISGIQRRLTADNLMFPFKLMSSLWKSAKLLRKFKADIAIGTGGFASGPLLYMAGRKGIPTVVQEQNSFPGITNKLLAAKASKICVAYDKMERFFPEEKVVLTGNPVRGDIVDGAKVKDQVANQFKVDADRPVLLVLGGSLGARAINKVIADHLELFRSEDIQLIWQTGKLYYEEYKAKVEALGYTDFVKVHAFLNDMNAAYSVADGIVSRAGAGTISELCLVSKPVMLIPSPNVAEDHQTKNAKALADKDAALFLAEKDLNTHFGEQIKRLLNDEELRGQLSENIKTLAKPNATKDIVKIISDLIR